MKWLGPVLEVLLGFALFFGWMAFLGWLLLKLFGPWLERSKARLARDQAGAERYGWTPGTDADGLLASAGRVTSGHDGSVRRVLVGDYQGRPIRMAEFVYSVRSRYLPTTYVRHLVAVELPVRLPDLMVRRQAIGEPGRRTFDAESGAFNRQYDVSGPDDRYVSAVMHPRMMEWLLAHPGLELCIHGNLVLAFADTPWTVPTTLRALPVLDGVADRIPRFVLSDYGLTAQ
ncbi:hypothetical protein Kfla_0434 [Kribbella flavida DSM 17836]|uniref:DUF3137 domain-containing protein n=1 Tax=Kribbella flavida (strain DSM 17836 / JCM 10339 / NBRC 14399) TaxID=479435 RepID=D2PUN9_KRIFD|nr:hypothetical protein [Kribbella flavida]ADB29557.1 hypothetical protein Kfla_0434 [Kribbella flavida DSM 17836]